MTGHYLLNHQVLDLLSLKAYQKEQGHSLHLNYQQHPPSSLDYPHRPTLHFELPPLSMHRLLLKVRQQDSRCLLKYDRLRLELQYLNI